MIVNYPKKIKILLIRPKFFSIIANLEPLGLEYVAGLCRDLNIDCKIFDEFQHSSCFRFNRLVKKIKNGGYDYAGFYAIANTTDYIIETSNKLKKIFPNLYIMIGGPEAELNYMDFTTDNIDFIYHDNGLESLKEAFVSNFSLDVLKKQDGICYKMDNKWIIKGKGAPVNNFFSKPDRNGFYKGLKKYFAFLKGSYALVKASFSCPYSCSFCCCGKRNSGTYTERAVMDVIDEIESINHNKIFFIDDTFFINKERIILFCEKLIEKKLDKQFMAFSRADFMARNNDIMPLLYKAGFRDILVGLEAADEELLIEYNKQSSINTNEQAIKNLRENNIVCNGLFVVNHKSSKKDFKKLLRFIKENKLLWVLFSIFTPYKGTEAYEKYKGSMIKTKSKYLDSLHITIKPEKMSSFMFFIRFYLLYFLTYPKIYSRTLFKTAYNTKKTGWI